MKGKEKEALQRPWRESVQAAYFGELVLAVRA